MYLNPENGRETKSIQGCVIGPDRANGPIRAVIATRPVSGVEITIRGDCAITPLDLFTDRSGLTYRFCLYYVGPDSFYSSGRVSYLTLAHIDFPGSR